jgi:hypothetical protein
LRDFEAVREKYKYNCTFYSDGKHICIKRKPSNPHARAASFVSQFLPLNNPTPDDEKIVATGDESNELLQQ